MGHDLACFNMLHTIFACIAEGSVSNEWSNWFIGEPDSQTSCAYLPLAPIEIATGPEGSFLA